MKSPMPSLRGTELVLGEDDAGEAGDQGAVEVEERADVGPRGLASTSATDPGSRMSFGEVMMVDSGPCVATFGGGE